MARSMNWACVAAAVVMAAAVFALPFLRRPPAMTKEAFEAAVLGGEIARVEIGGDGYAMAIARDGSSVWRVAAYRSDAWRDWLTDSGVTVREGESAGVALSACAGVLLLAGAGFRASGREKLRMRGKDGVEAIAAPPGVRLCDVAGNAEARDAMAEVCDFLRRPQAYLRTGARPPSGILLYGPPGTGKTTLARALAGEAGVPFIATSGSDFIQMYAGVGASRVRELFKAARKAGRCVIFIDEIDALGKRGVDMGAGGERDQTLNALLTEMSGFHARPGILVVAATNRVEMLDDALTRPGRFDRLIYVGNPDREARAAILRVHAKGKPLAPDVELAHWAGKTIGFSGARLERLLNEAAIRAARKSLEAIGMEEMQEAYLAVVTGSNLAALGGEDAVRDEDSLRIAAIHEAGHALVTRAALPGHTIEQITLLKSSGAMGGFMLSLPQESAFPTRKTLEGTLMAILGGRAAERLIYGEDAVSTGASDDLSKATELAWEMVARYGMDEELGPVAVAALSSKGGGVEHAAQRQCRKLLARKLADAQDVLEAQRDALLAVSDALVLRETLTGQELSVVAEGVNRTAEQFSQSRAT